MSDNPENLAFEKWKLSPENEKEECLRELVQQLKKHARNVCWQKLRDRKDLHSEIVNDSVTRAVLSLEKFRGKSLFSTWFHRIVLNEYNRLFRRLKESGEVWIEDVPEPQTEDEYFEDVIVASGDATDKKILAFYKEGYSSAEMAKLLNTTATRVRKRWQRLRERLRETYAKGG